MKNLAKKVLDIQDYKKRIMSERFFLKILAKELSIKEAYTNMLLNFIGGIYESK